MVQTKKSIQKRGKYKNTYDMENISGLFSVEEINNLLSVNVLERILGTNSSGTRSYSQPVAANTSELHTLVPFIQSHYECFYFSTEEGPTPRSHKTSLSGNLSYSFEMC